MLYINYESQGSLQNRTNRICIWKVKMLVAQSCPTLFTPWTEACQAPLSMGRIFHVFSPCGLRILNPLQCSPGKNTGVGSHSLLQGIFPTQGLNSGLLHCRQILYQLSHQGRPGTHYSYSQIYKYY